MDTMITARIARRSRSRSSTRWEMKVSGVLIRGRSDGRLFRWPTALRLAADFTRLRGRLCGCWLRGTRGRWGALDFRQLIELGFGFRHLALNRVDSRIDRSLEPARGVLEGGFELAQLLQLDLAVDVGLDVLDLALDGATAQLGLGRRSALGMLVGGGFLHAVLESAYSPAQVGADITEFLGAENEQNDQQHDQPVPNAPGTHDLTLSCVSAS